MKENQMMLKLRVVREKMAARWDAAGPDDRGDVPGWVLITLMTAGLVVAVWALAGPALADLFQQAIARVSGL